MNLRQVLHNVGQNIKETAIPVEATEGNDVAYWQTHCERFYRSAKLFLQNIDTPPVRVLDIGSHFLHFACLLRELGFEVWGGDVQEFANHPKIQERAARFVIHNRVIEPVGRCRELPYETNQFDTVFLMETVEHWNANPSGLLKEVYRILRPHGTLVVSTPNFYGYHSFGQRVIRLLTGGGGYQPVEDIIQHQNFSHHWKEYSRQELCNLFGMFGFRIHFLGSLTGVGDGKPEWFGRLCRPWGQFLYMIFTCKSVSHN